MSIGFDPLSTRDEDSAGDYDQAQWDGDDAGDVEDTVSEVSQDHADTGEGDKAAGASVRGSRRRKRTGVDKALIRRSAAKSIELSTANDDHVTVLATILGTNTDPVDLAVAVLSASKSELSVLTDVRELADSTGAERAVAVMTMGRSKMRAMWSVLDGFGAVSGSIPSSDSKAALALAGADISQDTLAELDAVAELAKKG